MRRTLYWKFRDLLEKHGVSPNKTGELAEGLMSEVAAWLDQEERKLEDDPRERAVVSDLIDRLN